MSKPAKSSGRTHEVEQLVQLIQQLANKVPGYPHEFAPVARLSALLEKHMAEAANEALRPLELTYVLYQCLVIIQGGKNGRIAPSELAELTGERPNNITHICNYLEEHGYITREHEAKDRRRVQLSVTPAGRRLLSKALPRIRKLWQCRFDGCSAHELAVLHDLLRRQIHNLGKAELEPE
jgi:MarR family transcriptional repressor of emrRAB